MPVIAYDFKTPSEYIYNQDLLGVNNGCRNILINFPGQEFPLPFTSSVGMTYDAGKVNFTGALAEQIDQTPAGSILGATFTDALVESWAFPNTAIVTFRDTPVHASNQLRIFGYINAAVIMENSGIGAIADEGAVKVKYIPNYSGAPEQNINIFEISNGVNNNNKIIIFHSPSGSTLRATVFDSTGVQIHGAVALGIAWSPVSGTPYEFEINFKASSGLLNIIIGGTVKGATPATTYARTNGANKICIGAGNSYFAANAAYEDLVIFDTVQHTANYTAGYTLPETIYPETTIITPELVWTGVGALVSFDSFSSVVSSETKFSLQVGRSGIYLYWDGAAWVSSNGSYSQSTGQTDFNANCTDISVLGEIYGQFKIHFKASNSKGSITSLLASLTAQKYSTGEPTIKPASVIVLDSIDDIQVVADSQIKYVCEKNGESFYYSSGWVASDKSYAKANTVAEIIANKSSLITEAASFRIESVFDGDGETPLEITQLVIYYSSAVLSVEFVVEDGTGKADSTSYATVLEFLQYWKNKGQTISEDDDTIKAWLNQATEYIDREYRFKGTISLSTQALQWPRVNVWKNQLTYYLNTEIPKEVKDSVCYLAKQLQTETEFYRENSGLKSYSIGPVSKVFRDGSSTRSFPITDGYLRNITLSGNEIVRAN